MAVLWDILDAVRKCLIESLDFRAVIISDDDVPASLMPAARIKFVSATSNSSAEVPIIFDIVVEIEILMGVKSEAESIADAVQSVSEILVKCEYPAGVRICSAPTVKNVARNSATIKVKFRWAERSE